MDDERKPQVNNGYARGYTDAQIATLMTRMVDAWIAITKLQNDSTATQVRVAVTSALVSLITSLLVAVGVVLVASMLR